MDRPRRVVVDDDPSEHPPAGEFDRGRLGFSCAYVAFLGDGAHEVDVSVQPTGQPVRHRQRALSELRSVQWNEDNVHGVRQPHASRDPAACHRFPTLPVA